MNEIYSLGGIEADVRLVGNKTKMVLYLKLSVLYLILSDQKNLTVRRLFKNRNLDNVFNLQRADVSNKPHNFILDPQLVYEVFFAWWN